MADRAASELEWMKKSLSYEQKIALFVHSKANVRSLMRAWDKSGDGRVTKAEFKKGLEIGRMKNTTTFQVYEEEVDLFFEDYDADGSGEIDVEELQLAMKKLHWAAVQATDEQKERQKKVDAMAKVAAIALKAELEAEVVEKKKRAAEAEAAAAAATEAEVAVQEQMGEEEAKRAARAAARAAKKAAEQAEFEARVEAKRAAWDAAHGPNRFEATSAPSSPEPIPSEPGSPDPAQPGSPDAAWPASTEGALPGSPAAALPESPAPVVV